MPSPDSHDYALIDRLAEEFAERFRRGERPTLQEYIDRYPHLEEGLREFLPAMVEIEQVKGEVRNPEPAATMTAPPVQQLGDYHILREIGQGGMGVVYEAEQLSLGRRVALKILPGKLFHDARQKRRFEREARAAARLHHTNIVPIFGVGEHDGLPYYVMQFIQGLGLDEVIDELNRMHANGQAMPMATPTPGVLRVARKDVSAEDIARSMMTGEYRPGALLELPSSGQHLTVDQPKAEPRPAVQSSAEAVQRETQAGKLSDTFEVTSSSAVLPGASKSGGKKQSYWQSVASIGVQVASALDYAHKQGILHRDIKPSNLLLDMRGTAWVTDFGLAKIEDHQNLTHTGDILGTLRYMPPEAFDGRSDPRSDVYALGLTLYEMLALKPAFDEKERHRLIKQVTTSEPARLDALNRAIPRDLVTIVHKAIEKEPEQRYRTSADLEADLQRFLDDEPIRARRVSVRERFGRWARRNRPLAAALSGIALLMAVIAIGSTVAALRFQVTAQQMSQLAGDKEKERSLAVQAKDEADQARHREEELRQQAENALQEAEDQRQEAEANFARSRQVVDEYLTAVSEEELLKAPGMEPLRQRMLQSALSFYEGFLKKRGNDPSIRAGVASAYLRLAKIHSDLNRSAEAKLAFTEAANRFLELLKGTPEDVEYQHGLAECYTRLDRQDDAIAIWTKLVQPDRARFQPYLANAYNGKGITFSNTKRIAEALEAHQQAFVIRERLVNLDPNNPEYRRDLGGTLNNIGVLLNQSGQGDEALLMYRRSVEHARVAFAKLPHSVVTGRFLATGLRNVANQLRNAGGSEEAIRTYDEVVEVWSKLAYEHPAVPMVHSNLYTVSLELSRFHSQLGNPGKSRQALYLAQSALQRLPREGPDNLYLLASVHALSAAAFGDGEAERAEQKKEADLAVQTLTQAIGAGYLNVQSLRTNSDLAALRGRADFQKLLAGLEEKEKTHIARREALEKLQASIREAEAVTKSTLASEADKERAHLQLIDLRQQLFVLDPTLANFKVDQAANKQAVGLIQLSLGQVKEAAESLREALALRETLVKENPDSPAHRADLASAQFAFAKLHWQAGRRAEARNVWEASLADLRTLMETYFDQNDLVSRWASTAVAIGGIYIELGMYEEAAAHYAQVFDKLQPVSIVEWRTQALLRLLVGDAEGHRRACAYIAEHFNIKANTWDAHHLTTLWSMAPPSGSHNPKQMIDYSLKWSQADPKAGWRRFYHGLVTYRAGQLEEALALLDFNWAQGLPVRAMIYHRLGQKGEARHWLAQAAARFQKELQEGLKDPARPFMKDISGNDQDRMQFVILLREARQLIEGKNGNNDLWHSLYRGNVYSQLGQDSKADVEFQAVVASKPSDPAVWLARARVNEDLGKQQKAAADFARAGELKSTDPMPWIEHGHFLAERGKHTEADAAFARAAALAPNELNHFLQASWWIVGPFPGDMALSYPPEKDPDPSRPVLAVYDGKELRWQQAPLSSDGGTNLSPIARDQKVSVHALNYLYSPTERTALLRVGADDYLRLWLNGRLIHQTTHYNYNHSQLHDVPVTLRAGRNVLLAKVGNEIKDQSLRVRLADGPIDRSWQLAERGQFAEAANLLAPLIERDLILDDPWLLTRYGELLMVSGQLERFRTFRAAILQRWGTRPNGWWGDHMLYFLNHAPGGEITPEDWRGIIDRVAALQKESEHFLTSKGISLYRLGDHEQARAVLSRVPNNSYFRSRCQAVLAMIDHHEKKAEEARTRLKELDQLYASVTQLPETSNEPVLNPLWWDWAIALIYYHEAKALIEKVDFKDDARWKALQAHNRQWSQKLDPATADFDMPIALQPNMVHLRLARAHRLVELQRAQEAEADFVKAVEFNPTDPHAWKQRGRTYAELGMYDQAAADFVKALELAPAPNKTDWFADPAAVVPEIMQWDEVFERVDRIKPKNGSLWMNRFQYFGRKEQYREAAAAGRKLLEYVGNSCMVRYHATSAYLQAGDREGYQQACKELLELYGKTDVAGFAQQTAMACLMSPDVQGDPRKLTELAEVAIKNPPAWVREWAQITRALADYRSADYQAALVRLQKLAAQFDNRLQRAAIFVLLAMTQQKLDQPQDAAASLKQAQTILDKRRDEVSRGALGSLTEWQEWVRWRLLFREAEDLLQGSKDTPGKG